MLVKYSTQSNVVDKPEDNGICRYWPAAGFCDRAMSEIVCQLWPQLVSHFALQKERREKGSGQNKFFKICLFAGKEESGRSS